MLEIFISIIILYIFISTFFSSLYNEEKVVTKYHDTDNQEVTKLKSTSNRHHNDIKHNNIQKHKGNSDTILQKHNRHTRENKGWSFKRFSKRNTF